MTSNYTETDDVTYNCKLTLLHGYKKHIVSNFLKDRHPYLEKPFNERYDPTEVFHSVFDRSIPKLVEILNEEDLPSQNYRESFMLLNEMASHQENKDIMISHNLVDLSLIYQKHIEKQVRREALLLLGSQTSVQRGRECLQDAEFETFPPTLNDDRDVREVAGWMLARQSSGKDGVEQIIKHDLVKHISRAFKIYSEDMKTEEAEFLIYLLESMLRIVQIDEGIELFLTNETDIIGRFNELLVACSNDQDEIFGQYKVRIIYLCLACIGLISVNHDGKEETVRNEIIKTANIYLSHGNVSVLNYAVNVMMFASIHLEGKNQCIYSENDQIVKKLIELLDHENMDIVTNVRQTLINVADLPKGFYIIIKYLSSHIGPLDNIFGATSIIPVYNLLQDVDNVPFFTKDQVLQYKDYANAIAYFINNEKQVNEALQYSIEKCCRITTKLLPFQLYTDDLEFQAILAKSIEKICDEDDVNKFAVRLFVEEKGDYVNEVFNTSVRAEQAKFPDLMKLLVDEEEGNEDGEGDQEGAEGEEDN